MTASILTATAPGLAVPPMEPRVLIPAAAILWNLTTFSTSAAHGESLLRIIRTYVVVFLIFAVKIRDVVPKILSEY